MSYAGETRLILRNMLDLLAEEGALDSTFLRGLERLLQEEKLGEEEAIVPLLDALMEGTE